MFKSIDEWVFSINSKPYGASYGEWAARWCQWMLTIPKSKNPTLDPEGNNAYINQDNPHVFFLCQTWDNAALIPTRTVNILIGQSIFMPIINWISFPDNQFHDDRGLILSAKKKIDVVENLELVVYGTSIREGLHRYRVRTPVFECLLPEDNVFELEAGKKRVVSDGYWVFLKPLQKSTQLSSFGSCSSGKTKISIKYTIRLD